MKIEIGESLIYSWLRHEKGCQIVQTNWRYSSKWKTMQRKEDLIKIKNEMERVFKKKFKRSLFNEKIKLKQIIKQAEIDAIGILLSNKNNIKIYAADIAFHEYGLRYGNTTGNIDKIIKKCSRTALCLFGYTNIKSAEIIFTSPKVPKGIIPNINEYFNELQKIMKNQGRNFTFRVIVNDEFKKEVLEPVIALSQDVADTNELFLRSYQMLEMFKSEKVNK